MANTIITKHNSTPAQVPLATQLAFGEQAMNIADNKLYAKDASGVVQCLNSWSNISGKPVSYTPSQHSDTHRTASTTDDVLIPYNNISYMTSSGNFTVPDNVKTIYVTMSAGGGGGARAGGGGGSGQWVMRARLNVTPGDVIAYIQGSGGTGGTPPTPTGGNGGSSSFGSYITLLGGDGGRNSQPYAGRGGANGGARGIHGDGLMRYKGGAAGTSTNCGGGGGAGFFGDGGNGGNTSGSAGSAAAANTGAGGGGGYAASANGNGGTGGSGQCVVEWITVT